VSLHIAFAGVLLASRQASEVYYCRYIGMARDAACRIWSTDIYMHTHTHSGVLPGGTIRTPSSQSRGVGTCPAVECIERSTREKPPTGICTHIDTKQTHDTHLWVELKPAVAADGCSVGRCRAELDCGVLRLGRVVWSGCG
jgi:hypothetical protein